MNVLEADESMIDRSESRLISTDTNNRQRAAEKAKRRQDAKHHGETEAQENPGAADVQLNLVALPASALEVESQLELEVESLARLRRAAG